MTTTQQTSFTSPGFDYAADISAIERRKKLAEALGAGAMQSIQTPQTPAGGFTPHVSPWQGVEKLAQALVAGQQQKKSDQMTRDLSTKAQSDYASMISTGLRQLQGTPATAMSEDASSNVTPAQPAVAPNAAAAMATFGSHPMGQALMPLAMQEMQRQRLMEALRGPQAAQAPSGAPPNAAAGAGAPSMMQGTGAAPGWAQTPSAAPQGALPPGAPNGPRAQMMAGPQAAPQVPGMGGPAGGVPMEAWFQADPSGKAYMEQLAKDHTEGQKAIVNRGYGLGRMVNGQYVPDPASTEQALAMERGKLNASQPYETPVTLKTSEGREIQLSRPEYAAFQQSGQLPTRYGGKAQTPQAAPSQAPSAQQPTATPSAQQPGTVRAAGLNIGIPGLGQTQADVIGQHAEQAYRTDRAKGYVKMAEDLRGSWQNAQTKRGLLDRLDQLFQDPNIAKGAAAENVSSLKNMAASMNIDIKGLSSEQAIQSITNEFAMQLRNPAGGAGMPGAMSDSDRKFLASIPPSLSKTPDGRKMIMDTMRRVTEREQEIANMAMDYEHKHGTLDLGFERQMRKFSNENPVFSTKQNGPTYSPATLDFLKKNGIAVPGV